jgi:putative ABC transport system permease protein
MIKNLFLIALRNFKKDKWYNLLNILGLTIGISFSLFLIFYIRDELNYDRYNKKADRIYRIVSYIQERDKNTNWTITQFPLGPTLKKDVPEVEEAVRFAPREGPCLRMAITIITKPGCIMPTAISSGFSQ